MVTSNDVDDNIIGDYKPGSVKKIKLENFLTHRDVVIKPGPRMNMVIGANGTGKSTILCAMCLGLGGEPKMLGRADDARAFIMHEQDIARIEITLAPFPGQPVHKFGRVIDRNKGSERGNGRGASTYFINGKKVNVKEIQQIVRETYNITIDNLCTFLPQDKVGSFSGFNQQDLLQETEKTLSGSQHLYNLHMELIEAEKEADSGDHNVDSIKDKLKKLESERDRFEREKERMEEREKAVKQADLIEKKIMWLALNECVEEVRDLKEKKKVIKDELKKKQDEVAPLEQRKLELEKEKQKVESKYKSSDQQQQRFKKDMEKYEQKSTTHDDGIEDAIAELRQVDSERETKLQTYNKIKEKVADYEEQMKELPPKEEIEKNFNEASKKKKNLHRQLQNVKADYKRVQDEFRELEGTAAEKEKKLNKLLDEKAQLRQHVFRHNPELGNIVKWLEPNRKNFRRPVWGPIACELSVKTDAALHCVAQHVPNENLRAFVVECKEDYDKLYNEIRQIRKTPISIILIRNGELKPLRRKYTDARMETMKREHGVVGYLDDTFSAPDAVMQALRSVARVHQVVMGSKKTDVSALKNFLSQPDPAMNQDRLQESCFFVPAASNPKGYVALKCQSGVSKYSGKVFTNYAEVYKAKLLIRGSDPQLKTKLQEELEALHAEMGKLRPKLDSWEEKRVALEEEGQEVAKKLKEVKADGELFNKITNRLSTTRSKLEDAEKDLASDDASRKRDLIKQLMNRIGASISALEGHEKSHGKLLESTFASAGLRIDRDAVVSQLRKVTEDLSDKMRSFQDLEAKAIQVAEAYQKKRAEMAKMKEECNKEARLEDPHGNKLPLFQELSDLPYEDIEEAQAALDDVLETIQNIHNDPNAIRQYEAIMAEIDLVKAQLEQVESTNESLDNKIQSIKGPWQQALETSIAKINDLFVRYMEEVGCTGYVTLIKGGDDGKQDRDYAQWGVGIFVSFRNGQKPQQLSARVQSGGERSVSTILYLMALQRLMVAPFRCVDEINQGLDERNERLVFRRIVENSTDAPKESPTDHSGQYFLITPKLLPNLTAMEEEAVSILLVMNGPFNFRKPTDFNVADIIAAKKRTIEAENDKENSSENVSQSGNRGKKKRRAN